jgi:two-component system, OmpR family, response regulator
MNTLHEPASPEQSWDSGMNDIVAALTRVLIIEDDIGMRQMLSNYLTNQNMTVTCGSSRRDIPVVPGTRMPDIIVLDLKLDHDDGLDLLRDIRHRSDVPLIIITGHRRDEIDRIIGLELGADDYLTKPFSPRELLARMRAVLRRQEAGGRISRTADKVQGFDFSGWRLDQRRRELRNPSGLEVPLTKGEFALLVAFLEAPARPLSREHLLQATRVHEDVFDRSIDVQVLRLRRKLEVDPTSPQFIQTERGIGYKFLGQVTSLQ